jgi:hypothetical protein
VTAQQRDDWIARVQLATGPRLLFRTVYSFESHFLAYSRAELERLGKSAALSLVEWRMLPTPFFVAKFAACEVRGIDLTAAIVTMD